MTYETVEASCLDKSGRPDQGDDAIYLGDDLCAVLDGVTSDSVCDCCGRSAGKLAVDAVVAHFETMDPSTGLTEFLRDVQSTMTSWFDRHHVDETGFAASAAVWNAAREELWFIGDCHAYVDGEQVAFTKPIDEAAATVRSAVLRARLIEGESLETLRSVDPGRDAIRPLLRSQSQLRNNLRGGGDLAYAALSTTEVPRALCEVYRVADDIPEIILASDGYSVLMPTLAQTEARLSEMLAADPLCIGELRGTKGVTPGNASFDDRTYLRIRRR